MQPQSKLLLFIILLILTFVYGLDSHISVEPGSSHVWRQSMGASQAYNYYLQPIYNILPRQMNVFMAEGYSWSEFPVIYYLTGLVSKLFGHDEGWLRLISLLIWFAGCIAIPGIVYRHVQRKWPSFLIGALFFTSPLVIFYSTTGLPDVSALAMFFIGWNLMYKSAEKNSKRKLYLSQFFFLLSALLKPTMIIVYLAFLLTSLISAYLKQLGGMSGFWPDAAMQRKFLISAGAVLMLAAAYHVFAMLWNQANESYYFLQSGFPIWNPALSDMKAYTFERTYSEWGPMVFHPYTFGLIGAGLLLALVRIRKVATWMWTWLTISLVGCIAYFLLFYYQFLHHDYYLLAFYPFILLLLLLILESVKIPGRTLVGTGLSILIWGMVIVWNAKYTQDSIHDRYYGQYAWSLHPAMYDLRLQGHLESIGIAAEDRVVSIPDVSPSNTLYTLKRHGFTEWTGNGKPRMDRDDFETYLELGAGYLIVSNPSWFNERRDLHGYIQDTLPSFRGLDFYKIAPH